MKGWSGNERLTVKKHKNTFWEDNNIWMDVGVCAFLKNRKSEGLNIFPDEIQMAINSMKKCPASVVIRETDRKSVV